MRLNAKFLLGLCATLVAAAVSMPAAVTAQNRPPSRTIEIGEFNAPVAVYLKVGDTLRVVLASTPSTGTLVMKFSPSSAQWEPVASTTLSAP